MTEEEFNTYYNQWYASSRAFLVRHHCPFSDLDDIVQTGWFRVWEFRSTFRGESSPKTWIYTVIFNVYRGYLRHQKVADIVDGPIALLTVTCRANQEAHQQVGVIVNAINTKFRPKPKLVATLTLDGHDLSEISSTTGLSIGCIKSIQSRNREALSKLIR